MTWLTLSTLPYDNYLLAITASLHRMALRGRRGVDAPARCVNIIDGREDDL